MGTNSKIEWTDHTWNPWRGCTRVSPACDNCYMYRDARRFGFDPGQLVLAKEKTFFLPAREYTAGRWKAGDKVFVCSWSDFFHPDADEWRFEAWNIMRDFPLLVFLLLTKRPERIRDCLPTDWGKGWPNVWLGVTAENQDMADERIPALLSVPATKRFVSIEPMLGLVDLARLWRMEAVARYGGGPAARLDWIVIGGESGPRARPMHPDWVRSLRDQCQAAQVPFMFKQWGEWAPSMEMVDRMRLYMRMEGDGALRDKRTRFICISPEGELKHTHNDRDEFMTRVGKKYAGCLLDGREWMEFPMGAES